MEEKRTELAVRLATIEQALGTLEEVLDEPFSAVIRDATIQRFEYTFEVAWKVFRRIARIEGLEANSPRQAIRAAYQTSIIDDIDLWFELLEDRNRTSHTYDETVASQVYETARRFPATLRSAIATIRRSYLSASSPQ